MSCPWGSQSILLPRLEVGCFVKWAELSSSFLTEVAEDKAQLVMTFRAMSFLSCPRGKLGHQHHRWSEERHSWP